MFALIWISGFDFLIIRQKKENPFKALQQKYVSNFQKNVNFAERCSVFTAMLFHFPFRLLPSGSTFSTQTPALVYKNQPIFHTKYRWFSVRFPTYRQRSNEFEWTVSSLSIPSQKQSVSLVPDDANKLYELLKSKN